MKVLGEMPKRAYSSEKDLQLAIAMQIERCYGTDVKWSTANEKKMEEIRKDFGDKDFMWELEIWGELAQKFRTNDKESYQAHNKNESYL